MADYWKSQPRKFCQYCKCWIADNKPSVEFHERGKNHKENVAAKISESSVKILGEHLTAEKSVPILARLSGTGSRDKIKKKSVDKAKQEERMSKQFAAMEEAAMKAYEEDLKRMERESAGLPPLATTQVKPQVKPQVRPQVKPQGKHQAKKQQKKEKGGGRNFRAQTESQVWVEGLADDGNTYYYNTMTGESRWDKPESFQGESSAAVQSAPPAQPAPPGSSSGCPWMEAVSPDGYTYYYNSETGESSWEKPAGFPSDEASGLNIAGEGQEEPSSPQPEPLSGGEESSNGAPASSQEAEVTEDADQQPKVPKISFRKRKAEPAEKEGEDEVSEDAPKEETEETKTEEKVQTTTAEPEEEKKKAEEPTQRKTQAKRQKTVNPYGVWEQIQEEEDPYASVDLQLPHVEASAPADLPPEPKPKFRERVITSLGDEGGPASFRKNKTQNGKSRSLRQRDNDD